MTKKSKIEAKSEDWESTFHQETAIEKNVKGFYPNIYMGLKVVTIVGVIVSGVWWLNSQFNNLRIETEDEIQNQTSLILEIVNENKVELVKLGEQVDKLDDDINKLDDKLDSIQSYLYDKSVYDYYSY